MTKFEALSARQNTFDFFYYCRVLKFVFNPTVDAFFYFSAGNFFFENFENLCCVIIKKYKLKKHSNMDYILRQLNIF